MSEQLLEKVDILVVDDDAISLKMAEKMLGEDYSVVTALSGAEALEMLEKYEPRLILLDPAMPEMDGARMMERLRENPAWENIPVIILAKDYAPETENEFFARGAADFIVKPFAPAAVKSRVRHVLELCSLQKDMEDKLEEKTRLLEKVSLNSIMAIANTVDAKDAYTSGHSLRVAKCAAEIARRLGWSEEEIRNLYHIGLLHDIGKIGVPDSILNKPSRLSDEEFAQIKKHPVIGGEILKNVRIIRGVADGALYHHERYDGKGYPNGLKGEEIPLCARIIAIADTYDAMTSNRIYRAKLPDSKVVAEFERCKGTQFDPELAQLFIRMLNEGFHIPQENRRHSQPELSGERSGDETSLKRVLLEYSASKTDMDHLTGLSNRSYGEAKTGNLLGEGHKGALLIVNLDDFKVINDTYGHLMGDKVLKILAGVLADSVSEKEVLFRLAGDEFGLFLTDLVQRNEIEERIHGMMAEFVERMDAIRFHDAARFSVGIALSPADGKNFTILYANADKALYYVKRSGKNAFSFFRDAQTVTARRNPDMDLDHIRLMLEGRMDSGTGAYKVPYEELKSIYTYLSRCVKRKGQMVQTLLFTLGNEGREYLDNEVYEDAMSTLEVATAYSLRMVDVGCRYSSLQYIVILVDTNLENGRMVAERVVNQFYKIYSGSSIALSYDIQSVTVQNE